MGSRKALAQQSSHQPQPGATPPAHTACPGQPAYLEAGVASLEASQEAGTGRAPLPSQLRDPFLGTTALRPLLGGRGALGGGWRGPQRGERTLAAASPTRSEVRHYVLSYTKLFLGVLVNTNDTWLRLKYLFCHNVSLGCVGPFLCSLC